MANNISKLEPCDLSPEGFFSRIDDVTGKMLLMDQIDAPIVHRFAPGLYIREVHLSSGSFVIGHEHKTEHFNIMLKGRLIMINEDGTTTEFIAPQSYVAKPGRKVVYIIEDTVWQNIFPSNERDIDKLEDALLNKSESAVLNEEMLYSASRIEHESDRFSYRNMLISKNLTEKEARSMSENWRDQVEMPYPVHPYRIGKSPIEGLGYFLTVKASSGEVLAPSRINNKRTPAGRYVNHSENPNAEMRLGADGDIYLVAISDINGCVGGNIGTEVTTDYSKTIDLVNAIGDNLCQQYIQG